MSGEPAGDTDVLIAGGNLVGATLACGLGGSDLRVTVVEPALPPQTAFAGPPEGRVIAVSPASVRVLSAVGAWSGVPAERICPYGDMRVWDAGGPGNIHFEAAALGAAELGWIVENRAIQQALLARAVQFDNVSILAGACLSGVHADSTGVDVVLDDGRAVRARVVAAADGAGSQVREMVGLEVRGWDYEQKGIVATVRPEHSHEHTAWQRFLPTGPLALLPLFDGQCSIVWSNDSAEADRLLSLSVEEFEAALAEASEQRLGALHCTSDPIAFPLRLQYAARYAADRVALLGDAAHTVHPLAGQGANLGFLDAAALAEVLVDAVSARRDPGSRRVLRRYERWRKGHNLLTMAAMDAFKRLFGTTNPLVSAARGIGLNLTDQSGAIKGWLTRYAMGQEGDLPRMARSIPD